MILYNNITVYCVHTHTIISIVVILKYILLKFYLKNIRTYIYI